MCLELLAQSRSGVFLYTLTAYTAEGMKPQNQMNFPEERKCMITE